MFKLDVTQHSILPPEASAKYLKSHSSKMLVGDTSTNNKPISIALKDAKINNEKENGAERQQAAQRFKTLMDSANIELWVGEAAFGSIRSELAQTDCAIKHIMNAVENKNKKEDEIQQDAKTHDDETSAATQNLDKAVDSLNQMQSSCGNGDQNPSQPTTQSQSSHDESSSHPRFELAPIMDTSLHWPT